MMKIGEILPVKEFNRQAKILWEERIREGKARPQDYSVYVWVDNRGKPKEYGYVGRYERGYLWNKTKKGVRKKLAGVI